MERIPHPHEDSTATPNRSYAAARPDTEAETSAASLRFYPVLHLMTGPPGLSRNGGIWKRIKANLREVFDPSRLMVQALHFSTYQLSDRAWEEWFSAWYETTRMRAELETTFGPNRDLFMDSGGFQLLHADKIDLSRWKLRLCREDILELQLKFHPNRIASLDTPIPMKADRKEVRRSTRLSLENAVWLAERFDGVDGGPTPYLVVHGRFPVEIRRYLRRLKSRLPTTWLRSNEHGIALGSQVPLASSPAMVVKNIREVLSWMDSNCPELTPLHVFGVGDGIISNMNHLPRFT